MKKSKMEIKNIKDNDNLLLGFCNNFFLFKINIHIMILNENIKFTYILNIKFSMIYYELKIYSLE